MSIGFTGWENRSKRVVFVVERDSYLSLVDGNRDVHRSRIKTSQGEHGVVIKNSLVDKGDALMFSDHFELGLRDHHSISFEEHAELSLVGVIPSVDWHLCLDNNDCVCLSAPWEGTHLISHWNHDFNGIWQEGVGDGTVRQLFCSFNSRFKSVKSRLAIIETKVTNFWQRHLKRWSERERWCTPCINSCRYCCGFWLWRRSPIGRLISLLRLFPGSPAGAVSWLGLLVTIGDGLAAIALSARSTGRWIFLSTIRSRLVVAIVVVAVVVVEIWRAVARLAVSRSSSRKKRENKVLHVKNIELFIILNRSIGPLII